VKIEERSRLLEVPGELMVGLSTFVWFSTCFLNIKNPQCASNACLFAQNANWELATRIICQSPLLPAFDIKITFSRQTHHRSPLCNVSQAPSSCVAGCVGTLSAERRHSG
jgi:hypothetical protein